MHNLYPHFSSVATCYLLVRVCVHRPAVELRPAAELGRVSINSRAESSLVQWSGEDRLIPTPECTSCSRVRESIVSGSAWTDSQVFLIVERTGFVRGVSRTYSRRAG